MISRMKIHAHFLYYNVLYTHAEVCIIIYRAYHLKSATMERYCSTDLTNNNARFIPYYGPLSCLKYRRFISNPCMSTSRVGETT